MAETDGIDPQDLAEVFDEDNLDTNAHRLATHDERLDFDDMPDVLDTTSARGDEDDEEALIGEDLDDADLVELVSQERDEDDEEEEDEFHSAAGVDADEPTSPNEVELTYVGDLSEVEGAHPSAMRYESRTLSDEDLEELGYRDAPARGPGPARLAGEGKRFDGGDPDAAADALKDPKDPKDQDELLDEAVEETFPASDPISPSHVT